MHEGVSVFIRRGTKEFVFLCFLSLPVCTKERLNEDRIHRKPPVSQGDNQTPTLLAS